MTKLDLKSTKILVTGGAGFIGSNLIKKLLYLGCRNIISLDNYSSGTERNHHERVTYISGSTKDIRNYLSTDVDYIFHFGEYSRVEASFSNISKITEYNLIGTSAVIDYWLSTNAKLIYSGSSTKFIDTTDLNGQSPYSITKKQNTQMVNNLGNICDKDFVIVYFYNVYGANENSSDEYGTVISKFLKMKRSNKPLTVVKPGSQKRNFTHIDDTVEGIILAAMSGKGDGYGIGAQESFSILDVAKLFNCEITFLPERAGNRMSAQLKTDKIRKLGWQQKRTLEQYIKDELGKTDV